MTSKQTIDAARVELLLSDLRLPDAAPAAGIGYQHTLHSPLLGNIFS